MKQDYVQAAEWYRKSAEQGNAIGQCRLGLCYYLGRGLKQDYVQAVEWLKKSAKKGNAEACCLLKSSKNPENYSEGELEEELSTEVTEEDIENGVNDGDRGVYSRDGKKLLVCFSGMETYVIKEGTKVICDRAFSEQNNNYHKNIFTMTCCQFLHKIIIPASVTSIGNDAFKHCSSLRQITIPASVTSIGNGAFCGCSSLGQITIPTSVTSIGIAAFDGCRSLQRIIIPKGSMEKFKQLLPKELWDKLCFFENVIDDSEDIPIKVIKDYEVDDDEFPF